MCVRVTLSTSCDSVGGVGLVTHYKCQKDLSPKPVHLLLGAAGATDGELVVAQTASTHHKTFTTYLLSLSFSPPPCFAPDWSASSLGFFTSSNCSGAFTAGVLLVNWYVTLRRNHITNGSEANRFVWRGSTVRSAHIWYRSETSNLDVSLHSCVPLFFYELSIYLLKRKSLIRLLGNMSNLWSLWPICFEYSSVWFLL